MRSINTLFSLSLLASTLIMSGCGRSVNPNQMTALPAPQNTAGSTYLAPVPQTTMNNSQAIAGGRATATSGGYAYEQAPSVDNTAYNYYNQQNPCLFPQPGQTGCQGGTNAYYGGQQAQQSTGAYPQYPTQTNSYAGGAVYQQQTYPQQNYTSQTGTVPTYQQQTTYPQNNTNYGTYNAPVAAQRAPQTATTQYSSATASNKAISRIDPNNASSSNGSSNNRTF